MNTKEKVEYPFPVLSEDTNDYPGCGFDIQDLHCDDKGSEIVIALKCQINCDGLMGLVNSGDAKITLRLMCLRTSQRKTYHLKPSGTTVIKIPKQNVADVISLQALVVATRDLKKIRLPELNKKIFRKREFNIPQAGKLSLSPEYCIKLDTLPQKDIPSIVHVRSDDKATVMKVHFPDNREEDPELSDYIVITLPTPDYKNFAKMIKKHRKNGVERGAEATLLLSVIAEAVGKLREDIDGDGVYSGTLWAESMLNALNKNGIQDLSENPMTNSEIANLLLGNVISDSLSSMTQKMNEIFQSGYEDSDL